MADCWVLGFGFGRRSRLLWFSRLQLQPQLFPEALTVQWLISASGAYSRASRNLAADIQNSNLDDIEMCRVINDRIMMVGPVRPSALGQRPAAFGHHRH